MKEQRVYIAEASKLLNRHSDTLRRWDKEGKLAPVRDERNFRYYNKVQLETFKKKNRHLFT